MRILIIGTPKVSPDAVKCYSDMWMYHLCEAFRSLGVELIFHEPYKPEQEPLEYAKSILAMLTHQKANAILAPGVRYFTHIPEAIGLFLRQHSPVLVTQIYDGSLLDNAAVDITFTVRDDTWRFHNDVSRLARHNANNVHIGWAADPSLFYPEARRGRQLRIFIDHAAFDVSGYDFSLTIMMNLQKLKALGVGFQARTLTDEGLVDVDPEDIVVRPYHRKSVPAPVFAAELRQADIFIVTHPESLGLTVLEAAMCGALIIAPPNCIPPDRLALVEHYVMSKSIIDWTQVLNGRDRQAISDRVSECTWSAVASKILITLENKRAISILRSVGVDNVPASTGDGSCNFPLGSQ